MNKNVTVVEAFRRGAVGVALVAAACIPLPAAAQTKEKPQPKLQPLLSQTRSIPAGTDTGSPTTSNSVSLGTPIPSSSGDVRMPSAAARAAARPNPLTLKGVPPPPAPIVTDDVKRNASRSSAPASTADATRPATKPAPNPGKASASASSAPR